VQSMSIGMLGGSARKGVCIAVGVTVVGGCERRNENGHAVGWDMLSVWVHVRGHPSVSLLPLSSPTLPLSICTPYTHLCIISKDRTYSQRLPGLTVQRPPRSRLTDSRRLSASPPARTSTALDGLRTHWDRSA
jgi:hypothetical protein